MQHIKHGTSYMHFLHWPHNFLQTALHTPLTSQIFTNGTPYDISFSHTNIFDATFCIYSDIPQLIGDTIKIVEILQ